MLEFSSWLAECLWNINVALSGFLSQSQILAWKLHRISAENRVKEYFFKNGETWQTAQGAAVSWCLVQIVKIGVRNVRDEDSPHDGAGKDDWLLVPEWQSWPWRQERDDGQAAAQWPGPHPHKLSFSLSIIRQKFYDLHPTLVKSERVKKWRWSTIKILRVEFLHKSGLCLLDLRRRFRSLRSITPKA